MANISRPQGLKPVGYLNGTPWNGKARRYYIPATDLNAYYIGHPVTIAGTADVNGVPAVTIGVAGAAILGSIVGIEVATPGVSLQGTTIDLTNRSIPATKAKDYYVLVADDPTTIFEIQEGQTVPLTALDIGLNCNFLVVDGATPNSDSATTTELASPAVTATLNLKLLGLAQREDNAFGAFAKHLVKINNHVFGNATVGI